MNEVQRLQGRDIRPKDIEYIRSLLRDHPDWNRSRVSREICQQWNWVDPIGRLKDMACRTMLLKLHRGGTIVLPPSKNKGVNRQRGKSFQPVPHDTLPIQTDLKSLQPINLLQADSGNAKKLWETLVKKYHYLGFTTRVGRSIAYIAVDRCQRPVGCLLFGAAAWKTAPRDNFIGWRPSEREANLHFLANNMRFLIPPWVRVPHLASHLLALAAHRIRSDWPAKYGFNLHLLETFVDTSRFHGTCYRAANWRFVGHTTGRTRNDTNHCIVKPIKSVYLYPLHKRFRQYLQQKEA